MKTIKFLVGSIGSILGFIYLIMVFYVYFNQEELIFQETKLAKDFEFSFKQEFEEIFIPSFDQKKLSGLLFKAKKAKGLIFYLHGNSGCLNTWGNIAENYTNLGYDIFILDYRGFGKSEGEIETEEQFNKDLDLSYKYFLRKYKEDKVVIIGYSIGTGGATILAAQNNPKYLILQAPYYNFIDLTSSRVPFFPNSLKKFRFETNLFIPKIKSNIFIFHGNKDEVISYSNSERLSKLLKKGDIFYSLKEQGHIGMNENVEYLLQLNKILNLK